MSPLILFKKYAENKKTLGLELLEEVKNIKPLIEMRKQKEERFKRIDNIIKQKPNIDCEDDQGQTIFSALFVSFTSGSWVISENEICRLLQRFHDLNPKKAKELINKKDKEGNTTLSKAIDFYEHRYSVSDCLVVDKLIELGADPHQTDKDGLTAFEKLNQKCPNHEEHVKILLTPVKKGHSKVYYVALGPHFKHFS